MVAVLRVITLTLGAGFAPVVPSLAVWGPSPLGWTQVRSRVRKRVAGPVYVLPSLQPPPVITVLAARLTCPVDAVSAVVLGRKRAASAQVRFPTAR